MSILIQTEVWKHSKASGTDLLLLLAIADNADEQSRQAFPAVKTIAEKCRITERGAQKCIRSLTKLGELAVTAEYTQAGRQRRNTYTIQEYMGEQCSPSTEEKTGEGEQRDTGRVNHGAPTRVNHGAPLINHHSEPPCEPSSQQEQEPLKLESPPEKLPGNLTRQTWDDFKDARKTMKAKMTDRAEKLLLRQLTEFVKQGEDAEKVVEQSIMKSWRGLFPVKDHDEKSREWKPGRPIYIDGVRVPDHQCDEQTGWVSPEFGRSP